MFMLILKLLILLTTLFVCFLLLAIFLLKIDNMWIARKATRQRLAVINKYNQGAIDEYIGSRKIVLPAERNPRPPEREYNDSMAW